MWRLWQLFEVNSHFVINKKIELKRLHIDFSLYNDKVFQKLAKSTSLNSSPCQVDVPVRAHNYILLLLRPRFCRFYRIWNILWQDADVLTAKPFKFECESCGKPFLRNCRFEKLTKDHLAKKSPSNVTKVVIISNPKLVWNNIF